MHWDRCICEIHWSLCLWASIHLIIADLGRTLSKRWLPAWISTELLESVNWFLSLAALEAFSRLIRLCLSELTALEFAKRHHILFSVFFLSSHQVGRGSCLSTVSACQWVWYFWFISRLLSMSIYYVGDLQFFAFCESYGSLWWAIS